MPEDFLEHTEQPKRCFCQMPMELLKKWATERYQKNRPTMELLNSTDSPQDKEAISIVALLDVDEATLMKMMGQIDLPDHSVLHCCQEAKKLLKP